jgi:hypothetical protein
LGSTAAAQSDIDPGNKFAWGENIGWTNWNDAGDPAGSDGVIIRETFLGGFVWGENVGWINLGDGDPGEAGGDETEYANVDGSDFGVNLDPETGELSGYAWGENIGWINFSGGALADPPNSARLSRDGGECRLRGYVWGENVGWINLDFEDAGGDGKHAAPVEGFCDETLRGDANCDGQIDFGDIDCFVAAILGEDAWLECTGGADCDYLGATDIDQDGAVSFDDIDPFVECLINGEC